MTAGSGPSNQVTPSATTNRLTDPGYSYDLAGNMTNDGVNALVYDGENRVTSGAGATYSYDGNSLRVQKASGATTTVYVFSGTKVIGEYENGAAVGSPTREYIYSGAQLLARIEGSAVKYYHQDHLSNRVITDANGSVVEQKGHLPFGETWYGGGDKWKFTTYERDSESGNDYAMFRSYVNRLGRFSSPDPLPGRTSNPQSLNRYTYVRNEPVNLTDPLGLFIGIPPENPDIWWLFLMFGGGGGRHPPLLDGSEGRDGGGGRNVQKKISTTFRCNTNAAGAMQALESNFAGAANYSSPDGKSYAVFSPGAIVPGETINIDSAANLPAVPRFTTAMTSQVRVDSVSPNSFTFETVSGQHPFYPGTITFSAMDAGSGQVNFTINVSADFAGLKSFLGFVVGGDKLENAIWLNLTKNFFELCQKAGTTK